MRKIIAILLAVMIVVSMAVPASACTPKLKIPSIKIPTIKTVEVKLPDDFWSGYFAENLFHIDLSGVTVG